MQQSRFRQRFDEWQPRNPQRPRETSEFASGFEELFDPVADFFVRDVFTTIEGGQSLFDSLVSAVSVF